MNNKEYKLYDKVWIMFENKPKKGTVTKIIFECYLPDLLPDLGTKEIKKTYFVSLQHSENFKVPIDDIYPTKEELIASL